MNQKHISVLLLASAAALLAGCASKQPAPTGPIVEGRTVIEPVVGSIWRVTSEKPIADTPTVVSDFVYERAARFCNDQGLGMLPMQGSSTAAKDGKPGKAWLEFRCQNPEKVEREYKGITLHFDEFLEDDKKKR